jgi:hypothetical protein
VAKLLLKYASTHQTRMAHLRGLDDRIEALKGQLRGHYEATRLLEQELIAQEQERCRMAERGESRGGW